MKKIIIILFILMMTGCVNDKENKTKYNIEIINSANGIIQYSPVKEFYEYGEKIILEAVPNQDYSFIQWEKENGVSLSSQNPYEFIVDKDEKIKVIFGFTRLVLDIEKSEYDILEEINLGAKLNDVNVLEMEFGNIEYYIDDVKIETDVLKIAETGIYELYVKIGDIKSEIKKIYVFNRSFQVKKTEDIVMYEINERAFSENGDFKGITEKLDYIKELGINTIWLMPVYPVGQINKKGVMGSLYSVSDYKKVNPEMGTMEDFNELIIEAHKRDIAVIIDWVANHTAWDHPWISQHKEWYTQSNGVIIPPIPDWDDVADLNFSNNNMQLEMIKDMKYWFEKSNIDGFRYDAADMVEDSFWKKALSDLEANVDKDIILLAEGGKSSHFSSGFQMNYSWSFYGTLKNTFDNGSASNLISSNASEYSGIPSGKHKLRFTTNHDETAWDAPPVSIFNGTSGAKAASIISTYLGGAALFYSGQEVGCSNKTSFFDKDPINWTEDLEMLDFYKKMIKIYNENEELRIGTVSSDTNNDVLVFTKNYMSEEILVIVNVRGRNSTYSVNTNYSGSWQDMMSGEEVELSGDIQLGAYEYYILEK